MTAKMRKMLSEYEDNTFESMSDIPEYKQATKLRQKFFSDYILHRQPHLYRTQEEQDWSYIARREYQYEVLIRGATYAFATGNVFWSAAIFWKKRMVWWPLLAGFAVSFPYYHHRLFLKTNKRLFDMCNVGEQYELGKARNEVLRECNRIQDREDF